jgi:imidazolonepropionase-like amidohydrolase
MKIAIKGATVYTVTKGIIKRGTVLLDKGKIAAVGEDLTIPKEYKVINGAGKFLFPGLVEAHCHVGNFGEGTGSIAFDGNEMTNPITPAIRALDGINPLDMAFGDARQYGITTICVLPGSGNVIGGWGVVLKTVGTILDDMIIPGGKAGLKAAFGENPKVVYSEQKKCPSTRMGTALVMREAWVKALEYKRKLELGKKDKEKMPERDLGMEALLEVLDGKETLRCHAHNAYDIVTAIRIAHEFGYKLTLEHCTEGHLITEFLAREKIYCSIGPSAGHRSKVELREMKYATCGILEKAGIKLTITTDAPVISIQYLPNCAGWAIRDGMSEAGALRAITINPAEVLGLAKRKGSIEVGKDADLGLWDGLPFDATSSCDLTMIEGGIVWEKPAKK